MHHFTQRTTIAIAALAATAALAAGAAGPAHAAAPPGTVTSTTADGLIYTASDDSSTIVITHGFLVVVDDTVPLKAGAGCSVIASDPTQATCVVPVAKPITVSAGGGHDTVTNKTSLQMTADGGIGDDHLYGGTAVDVLKGGAGADQLRGDGGDDQLFGGSESDSLDGSGGADTLLGGSDEDTLRGGTGDHDYLEGGTGADVINGGDGEHDLVSYQSRSTDVRVVLAFNPSGGNGEDGEDDQITQVEDARGGTGYDFMVGNERDNRLDSYVGGSSTIYGLEGADVLVGGNGTDFLKGGGWWGFVHDGAHDQLFGAGGIDDCVVSALDPDFADQCE